MNTSSFLTVLRTHAGLPLVFRAGGDLVAPGYHLTEVKRVSYETMDCGAMTHRWTENQFEVWVPASAGATADRGHMPAGKFLRIVDRVDAELPLEGDAIARIHASFPGHPAALYEIADAAVRDGRLWVELRPDRTRCKAAERRAAAVPDADSGDPAVAAGEPEAEAACGCAAGRGGASVACCA